MLRFNLALLCLAALTFLTACNKSSQEQAQQKAAVARQKAREEAARLGADAKKLGHEVKQEAQSLQTNGTAGAEQKLRHGGEELRVEAGHAGVNLDHASLIARVKAKLAADIGLSTVTGVDVDTSGHVVTLSGTVSTPQQKQEAADDAMQVNGVTRVVNNLQVQP